MRSPGLFVSGSLWIPGGASSAPAVLITSGHTKTAWRFVRDKLHYFGFRVTCYACELVSWNHTRELGTYTICACNIKMGWRVTPQLLHEPIVGMGPQTVVVLPQTALVQITRQAAVGSHTHTNPSLVTRAATSWFSGTWSTKGLSSWPWTRLDRASD